MPDRLLVMARSTARAACAAVVGLVLSAAVARAGRVGPAGVAGTVTDLETGQPLAGVTVTARARGAEKAPEGGGEEPALVDVTDASGGYLLAPLPADRYTITFHYADARVEREPVVVEPGKTTRLEIRMPIHRLGAQELPLGPRRPVIPRATTETGVTFDERYLENVPLGRFFGDVALRAPGVVPQDGGVSISGAGFAANRTFVDGLDVTDPLAGTPGTSLPIEFLRSVEVVTGGYGAQYGRAGGGLVQVETRSGGDALHGSVFANLIPAYAPADSTPSNGQAISLSRSPSYAGDLGFELGGPLEGPRLTYYVGFDALQSAADVRRSVDSLVDKDGDDLPDTTNGVPLSQGGVAVTQEVAHDDVHLTRRTYSFLAKVDAHASEDENGSVELFGDPTRADTFRGIGTENATHLQETTGGEDAVAQWTSRLFSRTLELHGAVGLHHSVWGVDPVWPGGRNAPGILIAGTSALDLPPIAQYEPTISAGEGASCIDGMQPPDSYLGITNCPQSAYQLGGVGLLQHLTFDQVSARLDGRSLFRAGGYHELRYGLDLLASRIRHDRGYSGSAFSELVGEPGALPTWETREFGSLDPLTDEFAPGSGTLSTTEQLLQPALYAQDSWTPLPNLAVNVGARLDWEVLYGADLPATTSIDESASPALTLGPSLSPRVGVVYDPTHDGRSRLFAHYARYTQGIPFALADQQFSGVAQATLVRRQSACSNPFDPTTCGVAPVTHVRGGLYAQVLPGTGAPYEDEEVAGGEVAPLAVFPDLVVGGYYTHRSLGNALGALSVDGGQSYFVGNPGNLPTQGQLRSLADGLARQAAAAQDPQQQALLYSQRSSLLTLINRYGQASARPAPTQTYDALTLAAHKRFARRWLFAGSYTLSRAYGNVLGPLAGGEAGLVDPRVTAFDDQPDLALNRAGLLPQNHTHAIKADGSYTFDFGASGYVVTGGSITWLSGGPISALGAHPIFGQDQTFLAPQGAMGTLPDLYEVDAHLAYGRPIGHGMGIEGYIDLLNLLDLQAVTAVDQTWSTDPAQPVVGGDANDLAHAKQLDPAAFVADPLHADGIQGPVQGAPGGVGWRTVARNPDYGFALARQLPLAARLGVRLTF